MFSRVLPQIKRWKRGDFTYLTGVVDSRSLLASSSMWTAVEKRFQKYGSRTKAMVGRG